MQEKLNNEEIRNFIKTICPNDLSYKEFITKVSITFGLRFSTISNLFDYPLFDVGKLLREPFIKEDSLGNKRIIRTVDNLYSYCFKDQEVALTEFYDYIYDLYQAYYLKDKEKIVYLRGLINDIPFFQFKKNYQKDKPLSDSDILTIVKFQLKYFYTPFQIIGYLGISSKDYNTAIDRLKELDKNLYDYYEKLVKEYCYHDKVYEKIAVYDFYDKLDKKNHLRKGK